MLSDDGRGEIPMTIGIGVGEREITTVPRIMRMILTRATLRSFEIALKFRRVTVAMKGRTAVNSTIFTLARNDRRNPAC